MMRYWMYILEDGARDAYYIGSTGNLPDRLKRHKEKRSKYTKTGNWKLMYVESFATRVEAMKRERQLKSYKSKKYIKWLIKHGSVAQPG